MKLWALEYTTISGPRPGLVYRDWFTSKSDAIAHRHSLRVRSIIARTSGRIGSVTFGLRRDDLVAFLMRLENSTPFDDDASTPGDSAVSAKASG